MPRSIKWTGALPQCDFCARPARYDGKTVYGPWANMCDDDLVANGYPKSNEVTNEREVPAATCLYCGDPATHLDSFNHTCCSGCEGETDATMA